MPDSDTYLFHSNALQMGSPRASEGSVLITMACLHSELRPTIARQTITLKLPAPVPQIPVTHLGRAISFSESRMGFMLDCILAAVLPLDCC